MKPRLSKKVRLKTVAMSVAIWLCTPLFSNAEGADFSADDIHFLSSLTLDALPTLPIAHGNQYADDVAAAQLGHHIFFDTGFSASKTVSCATCHQPQRHFSDGLVRGIGVGLVRRNTPSLLGAAYGPWHYWDGRKDSLWSQALEPFENASEHGISRGKVYTRVEQMYRDTYTAVFGAFPPRDGDSETLVFANIGKALMAYQRQLNLRESRFDRFVRSHRSQPDNVRANTLTTSEIRGLRLFVGRAACVSCHNGPLFTNFEFHNIGAPELDTEQVDLGRFNGIEKLRRDEFNCLSKWSDAKATQCAELNYLKAQGPELVGAFKTPSLRNVAATAPYMHSGQFATLREVLQHYNNPIPPYYDRAQHPYRPHFDIVPLQLSESEIEDLHSFLLTLTSPVPRDDKWWKAPKAPSAQ